jgi:hypothetical protein
MVQVVVAGVGMVPFAKPGKSETYVQMGEQAARLALDAPPSPTRASSRRSRAMYTAIQRAVRPCCTASA